LLKELKEMQKSSTSLGNSFAYPEGIDPKEG